MQPVDFVGIQRHFRPKDNTTAYLNAGLQAGMNAGNNFARSYDQAKKQKQQNEYLMQKQADLDNLIENPSHKNYVMYGSKYGKDPNVASYMDSLGEKKKNQLLQGAAAVKMAIDNEQPDVAADILRREAQVYLENGENAEANKYLSMADKVDSGEATEVKFGIDSLLLNTMGAKEYDRIFGATAEKNYSDATLKNSQKKQGELTGVVERAESRARTEKLKAETPTREQIQQQYDIDDKKATALLVSSKAEAKKIEAELKNSPFAKSPVTNQLLGKEVEIRRNLSVSDMKQKELIGIMKDAGGKNIDFGGAVDVLQRKLFTALQGVDKDGPQMNLIDNKRQEIALANAMLYKQAGSTSEKEFTEYMATTPPAGASDEYVAAWVAHSIHANRVMNMTSQARTKFFSAFGPGEANRNKKIKVGGKEYEILENDTEQDVVDRIIEDNKTSTYHDLKRLVEKEGRGEAVQLDPEIEIESEAYNGSSTTTDIKSSYEAAKSKYGIGK